MKTLAAVYFALLALLAITVFASRFALGSLGTGIGLAIAVMKTLLVAWFFMSLRSSWSLSRLAASAGVLWLFFFFFLGGLDFMYRPLMPNSWWR